MAASRRGGLALPKWSTCVLTQRAAHGPERAETGQRDFVDCKQGEVQLAIPLHLPSKEAAAVAISAAGQHVLSPPSVPSVCPGIRAPSEAQESSTHCRSRGSSGRVLGVGIGEGGSPRGDAPPLPVAHSARRPAGTPAG